MRVLIVGCGYVGVPLGGELLRLGHEVWGLRRSEEGIAKVTAAGLRAIRADITEPDSLPPLDEPFDWVINTTAGGRGSEEGYRRTYLEGTRNLIGWLKERPPAKFVYTSSTGVYGQTDGGVVKEEAPTEPEAATGRVLVETEQALLAAFRESGFPAVILRVAGIYGPERGHALRRFMNNEAVIPGRGERFINMIHLDDLVTAIVAALKNGRPGEIYNVCDDEPVAQIHFYRWLSESLGKYLPPFAPEEEAGGGRRGLTNKKVSNRRLTMELGCQLKYPNFRKGYTAEIRRLEEAGQLDIKPDPR